MIKLWVCWNIHSEEVEGRNICVKHMSQHYTLFQGELKADIFKLKALRTSEVGTKFDKPRMRDMRSLLVSKELINPLTT
jgi:hypothetical protein